jgi:hypothetical protein
MISSIFNLLPKSVANKLRSAQIRPISLAAQLKIQVFWAVLIEARDLSLIRNYQKFIYNLLPNELRRNIVRSTFRINRADFPSLLRTWGGGAN